jgi:xanthine dehydrogenase iron-sulfur cluster and FAD-binding subunit A
MSQKYVNAANLNDAVEILAGAKGSARIIAGATDLMLEMERGVRKGVETLVDISRAKDCNQISIDEERTIHIGPMVTHNQAAGSSLIREFGLPLALACWSVGSPQIRNRGTIAGNLITASPANDTIPALMALGASVTLASKRGKRVIALKDFYLGVRKTAMVEDELLEEICFSAMTAEQKGVFFKSALRNAQAISVVNFAIVLEMENKTIKSARLTLGSVAPTIIRSTSAEDYLIGKPLSDAVIESAAEFAAQDAKPISDLRGSDIYRKAAVRTSVKDGLTLIMENRQSDALPAQPIFLQGRDPFHVTPLDKTCEYETSSAVKPLVNGKPFTGNTGNHPNLLRFLRDEAGLTGSKEGCAEGECGACTIYLDGSAVMGCLVPVFRADQAKIETIESLSPTEKTLHPVQQAFIEEGAVQCGYCTPGFIMSATKLLEERPKPNKDEIRLALTGNLCRCTGYYQIINAVENASRRMG